MSKTQELTSERLREALEYEPESGVFTWRHRMDAKPQWNARHAGRRAGSIGSDGYRRITIDDVKHKASRLAFLYMKGAHPPDEVDHTDGQRDDDRWANLNSATRRQNMANRQVHRSNKLGIKGVCWYRLTGKYEAKISAEGKNRHLGYFSNLADAIAARNRAAAELYGEFARPSIDPDNPPLQVRIVKYGTAPLPEPRMTIASDGTVVDVSCVRFDAESRV